MRANAIEGARAFFGETLPGILKSSPQRCDAMRCTFTIRDAGVWFVDLRLPFQRCAEVTPENPPSPADRCCLPELELDAEVFERVLASVGETIGELARGGRIVARGDRVRALQFLTTIAKAPPLVWPPGLRFLPLESAFFAATRDELSRALPEWRPASETWDPKTARGALEPPFPYAVFNPHKGYWWESLVDFNLGLVEDADLRRLQAAETPDDDERVMDCVFPAVLWRGPTQILAVPAALTRALAELSDAQVESARPRALRWCYEQVRPVARGAVAEGRELWFWGHWSHLG